MGFACPVSLDSLTQRPGGLVSTGWYQSSWVQDVQGGPPKEAVLVAQETQGTVFLCTAGSLEITQNRGRVYLAAGLLHSHIPDKGGG